MHASNDNTHKDNGKSLDTVPKRRSLIVSAGASCFVSCPGCYNYFKGPLAGTRTLVEFIYACKQELELTKVTIGGGDPLTRRDIVHFLAALKQLDLRIHLDTVGTAFIGVAQVNFMGSGTVSQIDPCSIRDLVDLVGIPIDGSSDVIQQKFRKNLMVNSQVKILRALETAEIPVCANTVVHRGNFTDLSRILDIIGRFKNVCRWQLFHFMPIGPLGHKNRHLFDLDTGLFQEACTKIAHLVPRHIIFEPKNHARRKNRYLLIDGRGDLWIPVQSNKSVWRSDEDATDERRVIGHISDADIFNRIKQLEFDQPCE